MKRQLETVAASWQKKDIAQAATLLDPAFKDSDLSETDKAVAQAALRRVFTKYKVLTTPTQSCSQVCSLLVCTSNSLSVPVIVLAGMSVYFCFRLYVLLFVYWFPLHCLFQSVCLSVCLLARQSNSSCAMTALSLYIDYCYSFLFTNATLLRF